jgi:TetR/AcrR family transcriptional regulator, cholesterol catabolism regulator
VVSPDPVVVSSAALGRRERKKLETKDRILECAVGLFASRGYDATTMEDIGECADVARATVFNYFARKEDIVLEWFTRRRAEFVKIMARAEQEGSDTAGRLRQAFRGLARLYEDDPAAGRAVVRAWLRAGGPLLSPASDTPALLAATVRSGQQQGDVPPDVDADRAGQVIFDAFDGVLYRWVRDDEGRFAFEENLMATLDLVLAGITRVPPAQPNRKRPSKKTPNPSCDVPPR